MESGSVLRIPKARSSNILQKSNEIAERDTMGPRVQGQLSRLSSVDSFSRAESKHYKCDTKLEFNDARVSPHLNGNVQRGSFHSSKLSNSLFGGSRKIFSASRPGSRIVSRATSPVSGKSSPPQSAMLAASLAVVRSPEATDDDPKHTNDSLSREIINLRAQVENLTGKSQILEAELERSSRKLKEVTAVAEGEAEKCKAAKEVIKSLTAQLKEMAERVPEEHISISKSGSSARQTPNIVDMFSNENHSTSLTSPESESNGSSVNPILSSGTKAQTEKSDWVVQDEPGVYLTLSSLAGGGNELRRVRFSRKRFTEEQAEVWWAENGSKVCERHDIRSVE
ncbi:unnamed protein product, partial [Vitis vinifera]